jgi:hypothetical protein
VSLKEFAPSIESTYTYYNCIYSPLYLNLKSDFEYRIFSNLPKFQVLECLDFSPLVDMLVLEGVLACKMPEVWVA